MALRHVITGLCIEKGPTNQPVMNVCNGLPQQQWMFSHHYTPSRRIKG